MYLEYWGLRTPPFGNTPDHNVFFHSPQHKETLYRLMYAVEYRKGAAMLTGEVGSGKTTLLGALAHFLPESRYDVLTVLNPALDPVDFIRAVLLQFGEDAEESSKTLLLNRLGRILKTRAKQNYEIILIVDEAQTVEDVRTLEELRMLLNLRYENRGLLTIILSGQPRLPRMVSRLRSLDERIAMRIRLEPLDEINTAKYILYRLKRAGSRRGIFTRKAVRVVYDASGGIPLKINNICDRSLLVGFMDKSKSVTSRTAELAVEEAS